MFYNTVHTINKKDYTPDQLAIWAPDDIDIDLWCKPFLTDYTLIAESENTIVGFANVSNTGYLDRLYVHKDYQNMGIAKNIIKNIEDYAVKKGLSQIIVDASITSKNFFKKRGYKILKKNIVKRKNQELINYTMIKQF